MEEPPFYRKQCSPAAWSHRLPSARGGRLRLHGTVRAVRAGGDVQQARWLEDVDPVPFALRNETALTGVEHHRLGCGVDRHAHAAGENTNEFIAIRMQFTTMRGIARH